MSSCCSTACPVRAAISSGVKGTVWCPERVLCAGKRGTSLHRGILPQMPRAQTLLFELVSDRAAFSRQQPRQERHLSLLSRKSLRFHASPNSLFLQLRCSSSRVMVTWHCAKRQSLLLSSCFPSSPQSEEAAATDLVQGNEVQQPPDVQRQAPLTTQPRGHKCR